jgi:hypothetical protein
MKGSDNPFPSILIEDHVDPAAPANGFHRLFIDTDEKLKMIDHASLVTDFTPGAETLPVSIIAAKGDLIVGTANDTAGILTAGTNTHVLTADSTQTTGLKWAAAGGAAAFCGAKAYHNTTQSIASGAWRSVAFNAEDWDTDAFHDNSTNNSRFTIPAGKTGYYLCTAHFSSATSLSSDVAILVDGSPAFTDVCHAATAGAGSTLSAVLYLTAGQYVELGINAWSTTADWGHASARSQQLDMSVVLLGA